MKKHIQKIIFMLFAVMLLSACQPTPQETIVVNKGDDKLQKTIQSTSSVSVPAQQAISESQWTESYNIPNLECTINAQITVPDTNVFPVYKVAKQKFDSATAARVVNYFTQGTTGVRKTSDTKEDLEEQLILAKRGTYTEDDNGGRWEHYDGQQQDIASLEEKIRNAQPEAFNPITNDNIALPVDNTYAMPDGSREYINITDKQVDISNYKYGGVLSESLLIKGDAFAGELPGTTLKNIKISQDDALGKVNGLIAGLGIKNMGVAETERACIINGYTLDIPTEGWCITLTRNDGNSYPVDLSSSQLNGLLDFGTEDFTERWTPEMISVFVDETGIRSFTWRNPLEVTDVLNTNVSLLSFEDIKDRIHKNIEYGFSQSESEGWLNGEHQMSVNKIVLTNVLVPMKDDLNHQMLLPAWAVYYISSARFNGKEYKDPVSVFAVNAIDGSSIDLSMRMRMPEPS